ncbi:MAG: MFS transporter, partial [Comamonadaceae bacterium]
TLTVLLLVFGFSQLVWGPLSDRYGRRPVLLFGLGAYLLAAIGSMLAPSLAQLVLWRALQGAAMGASVMCARAIVRDLYPPLEGARVMSRAFTGLGLIACICAPLGGLLADWLHWRAALAALAVFGGAALWLVVWRYVESVPRRNPAALAPRVLFGTWRGIVVNPTFMAYTALSSATYCGLFTLLATSSFVFIAEGGMSRTGYGLLMLTTALAYIVGTFACRRLLPRLGVRRCVALAGALSMAGGGGVALLATLGVREGWALIVPVWVFMLAHGIHQPCSTSGAVGPFPQAAGAASALNGFVQMMAAFGMGLWLAQATGPALTALAHGMAFWGAATATIAWTLVARLGDVRAMP